MDSALSVSELNEYVSALLTGDGALRDITVRGEISGFKRHSSGHLYFSLKDEGALIRCVMFKRDAWDLDFAMRDGMAVVIRGSVALYVRDGAYQLYARSAYEDGHGELYARFMKLKAALEAEGLFSPERKRPLPLLPRCVGVVTSPTGAVLHDIKNVVSRRFPAMRLSFIPAKVQGAGAADEIAAAIRAMNAAGEADVIIVGRGGGSLEELWAFNEAVVARAIFESAIPVVSAVGHETDLTIADFTADLRAPTPSAAAELVVPEYDKLKALVDARKKAMFTAVHGRISTQRERVMRLADSAGLSRTGHALALLRRELASKRTAMQLNVRSALMASHEGLARRATAVESLSPARVLERGYALIRRGDAFVSSTQMISAGDAVTLTLADGSADANILRVERKGHDG